MTIEITPFLRNFIPLIADIGLLLVLFVILTRDLFVKGGDKRSLGIITAVGLFIVLIVDVLIAFAVLGTVDLGVTVIGGEAAFSEPVLGGMIAYDSLSLIFRAMVLMGASIAALISINVPNLGDRGEYYAILVSATLGLSLMPGAADLMMLFVALETASISLYVLAGFLRNDRKSNEASIKYYLFGAFTSGIALYGLSLLYGFTGTTSLMGLSEPLGEIMASGPAGQMNVIIAMLLILVGFGFKVSAVPFHFWTPDVYEGAPTPVTAFVSTASKAASFGLLMRFFLIAWPPEAQQYWIGLLAATAAITMTYGNILALVQSNFKRMLAYSSIAQAGYGLIGVVAMANSSVGIAATSFYMFMYVLTNMLAFAVIITCYPQLGSDEIKDYASLGERSPYLAIGLTLALLSLAGIPPLAGFFGKFFLFIAAVDAGFIWLAVVGVLNAIIALYYYLTVIKTLFVDPNEDDTPIVVPGTYRFAIVVSAISIIFLGVIATPLYNWATAAAEALVAAIN